MSKAIVVIFGMQINEEVYRRNESLSSPAYSFRYLSNFLSLVSLTDTIFVKKFHSNPSSRMFIFGIQIDNIILYCGIATANQPYSVNT